MASPQVARALPPWVLDPTDQWVTVAEYAKIMRRAERTVYQWLQDGTLKEFNVPVYKDATGKWWIKVT